MVKLDVSQFRWILGCAAGVEQVVGASWQLDRAKIVLFLTGLKEIRIWMSGVAVPF